MSNNLNEDDIKHLLQLIAISSFKGDALDRIYELKQKLLRLLNELSPKE